MRTKMLISYENKFLFIHLFKTGGSSIKAALKNIGDEIGDEKRHITASGIREIYPQEFDDFFKFAFVRNPWDWVVSNYFYPLQNEKHELHDYVKSFNNFEDYVMNHLCEKRTKQKDFITDKNGKIIVDFVGRFEKINNDFSKICDKLGIDNKLPHKNASKREDYRKYYNERMKKKVYDTFKEDIELFNYSF